MCRENAMDRFFETGDEKSSGFVVDSQDLALSSTGQARINHWVDKELPVLAAQK